MSRYLLPALFFLASPAFAAPAATQTTLKPKVMSVHHGDPFTGVNESNQ
jgi:hypothetical protein